MISPKETPSVSPEALHRQPELPVTPLASGNLRGENGGDRSVGPANPPPLTPPVMRGENGGDRSAPAPSVGQPTPDSPSKGAAPKDPLRG